MSDILGGDYKYDTRRNSYLDLLEEVTKTLDLPPRGSFNKLTLNNLYINCF